MPSLNFIQSASSVASEKQISNFWHVYNKLIEQYPKNISTNLQAIFRLFLINYLPCPWPQCWILDQHQNNKPETWPANDDSYNFGAQFWFQTVQNISHRVVNYILYFHPDSHLEISISTKITKCTCKTLYSETSLQWPSLKPNIWYNEKSVGSNDWQFTSSLRKIGSFTGQLI